MAKGIVIQITGDGAGAAEALRIIEEKMQETAAEGKEHAEELAGAWEKVKGALEAIGVGFGLEEGFEKVKEMIKGSMELGVELGRVSQQSGISAENLSVLKYAAQATGIEFETLTKGFKKLSTEVYEAEGGSRDAQKAFAALHISEAELESKGNDLYAVLALVADKFRDMPDGIEKNAIATRLFGRAGQELIPILNQGAAALDDIKSKAPIFTDEDIEKMHEMHKATEALAAAWEKFSLDLTVKIAPTLTDLLNHLAAGNPMALQQTIREAWARGQKNPDQETYDAFDPYARASAAQTGPINSVDDKTETKAANKLAQQDGEIERFFGEIAKKDEEQANQIVAAHLKMVEASQNAEISTTQSGSKLRLAILDAEHKQGTLGEQEFLRQKLALVNQESQQEIAIEQEKRADLEKAISSASGPGNEQRKLELEAQLAALDAKLLELAKARAGAEAQVTAELEQQAWAKQVAAAQLAIDDRKRQEEQADRAARTGQHGEEYDEKFNVEAAKGSAQTITSFMDQLSLGAERGRLSMKRLVDSAISDLDRWAMKIIEERAILPALNALFGVGGSAAAGILAGAQGVTASSAGLDVTEYQGDLSINAGGGDIAGPSIVGDEGPELFMPSGPGTVLPNDLLSSIRPGADGGSAPSVTINNVNNSSQPVQMKQSGISWDGAAREFVIHTVLEDWQSGGPVSQAMKANQS